MKKQTQIKRCPKCDSIDLSFTDETETRFQCLNCGFCWVDATKEEQDEK